MRVLSGLEGRAYQVWRGKIAPNTAIVCEGILRRWLTWMQVNGGEFSGKSLDEMVEFQKRTTGEDRYQLLDLVETWVQSTPGTASYKRRLLGAIRGFFTKNRADFPRDPSFQIRAEKAPVNGDLPVEEINRMLSASNRCMRAVALSMVSGGMGWEAIEYWNSTGLKSLRAQLSAGTHPIRVDLPGRKKNRNIKPYYTLLGRDAVDALEAWLEVRPEGTHIFYSSIGTPLSYIAFKSYWLRHLKRLGLTDAKPTGDTGRRTGKSPHELRDVFRTRWEKSGASGTVAEFLMGHVGDPLGYNKATSDESYVRAEYRKAERWLNVVSMDPSKVSTDRVIELEEELQKVKSQKDGRMEELQRQIMEQQRTIDLMMPTFNMVQRMFGERKEWDKLRGSPS